MRFIDYCTEAYKMKMCVNHAMFPKNLKGKELLYQNKVPSHSSGVQSKNVI